MNGRTFLILATVCNPDFPKEAKDVYNFVEFIAIDPNITYIDEVSGRTRYKEFAPAKIVNPKDAEERYCEEWRMMENTNLRSKTFLVDLVNKGVVRY